jgi:hypothetical protein
LPLVEARLWPNYRCGWLLSGILAHEPEQARLSPSPMSGTYSLFPVSNPNATVAVPASMLTPIEP